VNEKYDKGGEKMNISEKIKAFRFENDLSQEQFAKICGLHRVTIATIEEGKREPGQRALYKIEKVIGGKKDE
jgi:transcriptional regulator with XRE-family HTH domain